jgi:digeranylgeranylglycerophospholipid reductase
MVSLEAGRCCYCGGCVSVCPVEALALAETRLQVAEACIDCGACVAACPVGALASETAARPAIEVSMHPVRRHYDVVVVGAGPGGAVAAATAAAAGLSVLLLEKRQEIGSPVRCAEGVGHDQLSALIEPDQRWIAAEIHRAQIDVCSAGSMHALMAEGGRGYILERRVFDRLLAERAAAAGADVRVKTAVTGLLLEHGQVRGVRIARTDFFNRGPAGMPLNVAAEVVIAADGVEAQVGRWAGLDVQLPLSDSMACAQYVLSGVDIDPTCTYYTIGHEVAPGGYAWVFPKGDGTANVGLGVRADLWQDVATGLAARSPQLQGPSRVLDFLDRFIESDRRLARGCPVTLIAGNVPVALSPARLVTDGLMLVGDAARQVDPLTGGGIINAMTAGRLAGQVAVEAVVARDNSTAFLTRYEDAWQASNGRKLQRNYRLREKFPPESRSDERFVRAFALATK